MSSMFNGATSFNQPLNDWNVSSATRMSNMFLGATSFNQPLNDWNVSSATRMSSMFRNATSFNGNISSWDVSSVRSMDHMFSRAASFNGNISSWDVSSVRSMSNMFFSATSFDQPLSGWNVSSVTDMSAMFNGATSFNQNLGTWYIMPATANFDANGASLDVTTVSAQNSPLRNHSPDYGIGSGGASELFEITGSTLAFKATPSAGTHKANVTASGSAVFENGNNWRILVIEVTDEEFESDAFVTTWGTAANSRYISIPVEVHTSGTLTIDWGDGSTPESVTTNGTETHTYAAPGEYHVSMTGDLSRINLSSVSAAKLLLIHQWGDIEWSTMENAFWGAVNMEYRATDAPDLSSVTDMSNMFRDATSFDGNISGWNVSSVANMDHMFAHATSFNQPLNDWDVSSVANMDRMFAHATSFNQPLNDWNVSSVTDMLRMFTSATSFNQPLNDWNVSSVTIMASMFQSATSFNQPLNDWNVSSATSMYFMFLRATAFNQNLGEWYVVANPTSIARTDVPGVVAEISAQNARLDGHTPTYGIGDGIDKDFFEIVGSNQLNMTSAGAKSSYTVNVTASGTNVFENGNNWRLLEIRVTGQTTDTTPPPTFVSSELDTVTRVLTITFSETIDVTNVVAAKIHIRESGNYTGGGITMTAGELGTTADASTISFTLPEPRLKTVTGLTTPELTIEPGAVRDTSDNLIDGTFDVSTAEFVHSFSVSDEDILPTGMAFSNNGLKMFVVGDVGNEINEYTLSIPFDLSTAAFANVIFSVLDEDILPTGMAFSNNGTKMFVVGDVGNDISVYNLTAPFDLSTAAFANVIFSVDTQDETPKGMAFSNNGYKMFVVGWYDEDINEYTLDTPFDVSTADFDDVTLSVSDEDTEPTGMAFSNNGLKMFVVGDVGNEINEYTLSIPFDLSTAAFADVTLSVSDEDTKPQGMAFSNDGIKMFVVGNAGNEINEYTLSSVYPIMVPDTEPPVITLEGSNPATITVGYTYSDAGAICDDNVDASLVLTPSGTVDTNTVGSYLLTYSCTDAAGNMATQVTRTVNVKALPLTFVSSELDPTTGVLRITFSETIDATPTANIDPTKIHIRESGNYTGGGITLTAGELGTTADASTISFILTAPRLATVTGLTTPELTIEPGAVQGVFGNLIVGTFDVSTATFDKVTFPITRDIFPAGMAFSNDGTKMFVVGADGEDIHEYALPTPFTVSTVTHVASLSVSSPSTLPRGIAFSNDGAKMFIVDDAAGNILEYALPTPFTVSTARYVDSLYIFGQEEKPRGMAFSNDGAKMFVVGNDGNDINEYTLFPPFNITSATFADVTFDVSGQDREPQGMAFSNDGTKMFVVGSTGDSIYEYTLITPFNLTTATYDGIDEKFSVMTQELVPQGMAFSNDGTKMFVVGSHGNEVNQYTLSSVYPITVTGPPAEAFITTWKTTTTDESITLPISGSGMTVNWGDGDTTAASGSVSHTYNTAGDYTIQITGELTRFYLNNAADASKLVSIDQWGTASWTTMNNAFSGASNMVYNAADSPDLSSVTDMSSMFAATTSFNGNLSSWGVSSVTDMEDMFFFATSFNGNLSGWDVSSVTDMGSMFTAASSFNGNLSGWDVSSVTDMGGMFTAASSFNGNLSGWDVSSVTDMGSMFNAASDFNQPLSSWDVSSVTDMGNMFNAASSFNGNLSGWDVSSVTDMGSMFNAASDFNQPLSSWDVSSVTDMPDMFNFASDFNQPLSSWDVSSVENMYGMFRDATSFNGNLSNWNVSSVTNMGGMFNFASDFNQPLSSWNVSSVTDMSDMFLSASSFDQNLGNWYVVPADTAYATSEGTLNVTTISTQNAFLDDPSLLYGIGSDSDGNSNLFNITNSNTLMFKSDPSAGTYNVNVTAFGTDVFENGNNWRVLEIEVTGQTSDNTPPVIILTGDNPTVLTVGDMYTEQGAVCDDDVDADKAATVAGDMVDANTPGQYTVTYDCTDSSSNNATQVSRTVTVGAFVTTWKTTTTDESITLPISGSGMTVNWGDGQTSTASGSVSHTYNTAGDYTIQITGELTRFYLNNAGYASKLVSIDQWGTASWTTMNNAFWGASNMVYNAADSPDLSSVTDMSDMFRDASSFNGNLSSWNVSSVTNMDSMFSGASDFNQPLSNWNVSKVTNMGGMFRSASSFNGNLSSWDVSSVTRMFSMFSGASDFNQPLSRWDVLKVTNMAAMFASASSFNGDLSRWDVSSVTSMNSMFSLASSFNGDLSSWDVSKVTNMSNMFFVISVFQQNLGNWYVVPADTAYDISEGTLIVTTISAQNAVLDRHTPMYGIGSGGNSNLFNITNSNTLMFKSDPSAGTYNVVVTASGTNVFENGNNWRAFEVTVTGQANAAPVLNSIGSKSVDELAALSFTTTATDGDNDTLMFSLTGTPPSGASIHQDTGAFSWTPTEQQDGSHSITVSVSDGNGGSDSETITVTVNEVNADPVLASVGSKQVNELAALSFTASASDGDTVGGTADTLEFSLTGTPPSGASIHQDTGAFSWTPSESQDGTHTITVQVEDGAGATDSETITVTVNEVNADPALASVGSKTVNELAVLSFTAAATDGDVIDSASDSLEFSLTGTPPSGASINQNTGAFSWTPSESQDGTHTITVQVEDGAGATDSETITVTVNEVNADPALASVGSKQVNELAALSFTASASDGDTVGGTADTLEFSLTGTPPSGASINQNTGAFSWTPSESQDGTHTITVQVEDGAGATDSETITVTVNEVNADPALASVGSKTVNELAVLSFTAAATDGDVIDSASDSLEFSLTGTPPSGASINQNTGAFSWTPSESQDGTHTITVQVEDGAGATDSEAVTVTVSEVNITPVLNPIGSKSVNELAVLSFTVTASDGDIIGGTADSLTFSLTGTPPSGASIHQDTGAFSWTPTASQAGEHTVAFQVRDSSGATDSEDVTVTVSNSNQNPILNSIGSKSVDELAALSFTATATDGDNDTLMFSLTGTPPSGASIHQDTGAFSWTPTEQQDGSHSITVSVSDGNGGSDSETITVTVNEVNADPVLASVGSKTVNELAALSFTAAATDGDVIDSASDSLEFSLTGTPPSGASINQNTGAFSWTPTEQQDGTHTITVQVEDGAGATDSEAVTVTVSEVNITPVLNPIGSKSVNELAVLFFTVTASDGDIIGGTADSLTFSLTGTPPSGASIHQDTGAFSWTPTASQAGEHTVAFQVRDSSGATDSEDVTVTVSNSNQNPILNSIGSKSVDELAALSFTATATDGDNDTLMFSLTGTPPSGASIHQDTGAFSWTPTEQQDGSHSITVSVSDGNGGSDSETITVTVNEVNADPVLASVGSKTVNELAVLSFTAAATDGDVIDSASDSLEFSLTGTPPSGASINQNTGAFSWTPTEQQDGTHTITVQVEDGAGATDSEAVTVTVSEVNITPVLNPIGSKSVNELAVLSFTVTASDGDIIGGTADSLTFSLTGTPPSGASIHQDTGAFSWTPTASQAGEHTVAFQVRDSSGATDSEDVTVTVSNSNQNPILNSIGSKSVDELAALSFTATATDGDNDTLMFSLTGTPPSGASIHQDTGAFSWTPTEQQDGSHSITVSVSDGNGGSDSETITVTVNEVNADPVLASVGSKTVNELAVLSFTAAATDGDVIDSASDSLEFSLTGTPPSGASINQNTGAFSWTPSESQDGTHTITVQVEDGAGATDSEAVTVTVSEVNITPVLNPIGSKSVNELAVLSFTVTASDGDIIGGTADSLTFSLTGTPPSGASIHQDTGAFSWTPTASQAGEHTVAFQVRDSSGATDSEDVTVTVSNSNQNPILNSIGSKSVDELAALSFTTTATDGDNDTLMFSLTGTPPSGASIHQDTGAFSWTPTEQQDGSHSITVSVSDGNGGSDSETITVTVNEVNADPVLASVGSKQVNELAVLSFTAAATDGDVIDSASDSLEFSLTGTPPSGASINQNTGAFSWTPSESQDGTHTITVQVEDGAGATDSEAVTVTVSEVNITPVLNPIGSKSVNELAVLSFTVTASDGDIIGGTADSLTFSLTGTPPSGASIHQDTGAFSWTPTASQAGEHTVAFQVRDSSGATDSEDVTVTVSNSNQNPILNSIGSKSVDELAALSFTTTATDGDNDTLMFSLTGTPPSGASIHQDTGAFSWTPTEQQDGSHSVTVRVSDGNGGSDSETITVTVNEVNADPVLASVGSKQVNELAALSFTAAATDGDVIDSASDSLEFSLTGTPPSGASINQNTGAFSWTPTEQQDGTHTITVQVEDGAGATDSEAVTVTVSEVNITPVLNPIGSKSVNELAVLSFTVTASDGDIIGGTADSLTFSLTGTPPPGASIHQDTGAFSWTPTASQAGEHTVAFQVRDSSGATDSEDVTVTVSNSNQNPILNSIGSKSVDELAALSFTATATDGDNDTLMFSLTGTPPSGASINQDTGAFSWTPTEQQDGSHSVTVRVSDGNGGSDSETITVTVNEVNADPVLASVGSKQVNELAALSFTAAATDGDVIDSASDSPEFSLTGTPPSGASINQNTGAFSWTPSESQDGTHTITVQVEDGAGATDSEAVTVTVSEVNITPVLNPIGSKSVNELAVLSFTVTASDGDIIGGTADSLTFSLTGTPPPGASIHQDTGAFSWTPTASQAGEHTVAFQVRDSSGATDSEDVTVTVSNSNQNPILNSIGSKSVDELAALSFTTTATDGDNDTLMFSLTGTPPSGASIHQDTGAFSWTPTEQQDGSHSITVSVSDGNGGTASETVTVTVGEVNTAPVLDSIGPQGVNMPGTLTFTATATDGDVIAGVSDTMTFSMTGAPAGASMDSLTGTFSWTPAESQTGTYTMTVRVDDGSGASDSENVTVTATEGGTNDAPVLDFIGSQEINELGTLEFTATATDNDGDSLTFTMAGDRPRGASMTPGGMFSWTPDQSQDGDYSITVRVSDGRGGTDSEVVTVTVHDIAPLPVSARDSSSSAIALTLSETVTSEGQGSNGFEVMMEGDPVSVESITGSGTTTLTLNLDGTISASDGVVRLSYFDATGDVADENSNPLASFSDLDVLFPSQRRGGTTPPAVDLGTLAYQRSVDIPPHIAEQIVSHDASEPLEPITPDGTFDFPLVINGYGYLLDDVTNTLVPQILTVGDDDPATITFTVYTQKDLAHFALYLNLQGENTNYADSDTYITYKNDDGTTGVTDPHGYIDNAAITVTQEDEDSVPEKKTISITIEFGEEPMGSTNMVAYMWNTDRKATFIKIIDAIGVAAALLEPVVQAADPEPLEPDSELPADPEPVAPDLAGDVVDPEPVPYDILGPDDYDEAQVLHIIRMWSGFESEMITDTQLLELLGLEGYRGVDLPDWMMTELGVLAAKGDVATDEFLLALQYVLENL